MIDFFTTIFEYIKSSFDLLSSHESKVALITGTILILLGYFFAQIGKLINSLISKLKNKHSFLIKAIRYFLATILWLFNQLKLLYIFLLKSLIKPAYIQLAKDHNAILLNEVFGNDYWTYKDKWGEFTFFVYNDSLIYIDTDQEKDPYAKGANINVANKEGFYRLTIFDISTGRPDLSVYIGKITNNIFRGQTADEYLIDFCINYEMQKENFNRKSILDALKYE